MAAMIIDVGGRGRREGKQWRMTVREAGQIVINPVAPPDAVDLLRRAESLKVLGNIGHAIGVDAPGVEPLAYH